MEPAMHTRPFHWLLLLLVVGLVGLPVLLRHAPLPNLPAAHADEDDGDDGDDDGGDEGQPGQDDGKDDPGPDLGDQDVPFTEQVNRAIEYGVRWLRAKPQLFDIPDSEGLKGAHWGLIKGVKIYGGGEGPEYRHPAGATALALYTLLKCGVSPKDPIIERGFDWLRSFHQVTTEWDAQDLQGKTRHWTHTIAGSSYELSAMILALTAKYDPHKKTASTRSARSKGRLKIKDKNDRIWMQQLVTALVNRRGQPLKEPFALDRSMIQRMADPEKEEDPPVPKEEDLPPREERLGWRYNVPSLNLVQIRKSGKSTSTDNCGRVCGIPPHANQDLSSTQLATLALFAAQQFNMKIPPEIWLDVAEFTLAQQEPEGPEHKRFDPVMSGGGYATPTDHARGFMYIKGSPDGSEGVATGSMTACGIANLLMAIEASTLTKKGRKLWTESGLDSKVHTAIWDGLAWLDLNWSSFRNTNSRYGYHIYYLYAVEREQDMRGKELVGSHPWYREGALELLKRLKPMKVRDPLDARAPEEDACYWETGDTHEPKDVLDTCFALLFLKRATKDMVPVPITPGEGAPVDNR